MVFIGEWAFAYSCLLDVTVPSSVTFLGQVILTLKIITFKESYLIKVFFTVCMLVRVFCHCRIKKRVLADLTCNDSGVHLLFLPSVDLYHHSDVSGCYCSYEFSISAPHRWCKSVLKVDLIFYD